MQIFDFSEWKLIPDGNGGFFFDKSTGFGANLLLLSIITVIGGYFLSVFMDKIYTQYGTLICIVFATTSVLYFLQQLIQRPKDTTLLSLFLSYLAAPFFVFYLIAGSFYVSNWAEEIAAHGDLGQQLLVLLYIISSPALSLFGGTIINLLLTVFARSIPINFNRNNKSQA